MEENELPEGTNRLLTVAQHMLEIAVQDLLAEVSCIFHHIEPSEDGPAHQHGIEAVVLATHVVTGVFIGLRRTFRQVDPGPKHRA